MHNNIVDKIQNINNKRSRSAISHLSSRNVFIFFGNINIFDRFSNAFLVFNYTGIISEYCTLKINESFLKEIYCMERNHESMTYFNASKKHPASHPVRQSGIMSTAPYWSSRKTTETKVSHQHCCQFLCRKLVFGRLVFLSPY